MTSPPHDATIRAAWSPVPMPREHGAWGLLLQPFVAGAVLAREWSWFLLAAVLFLLTGFAFREPVVVIARQAFVWRQRQPQTAVAIRWLLVELVVLGALFGVLATRISIRSLSVFSGAGALLTAAAVWAILRNKQRSRLFQSASAIALAAAAPFSVLAARGTLPDWVWPLWVLLSLHGVASIQVVHERLERRTAAREGLTVAPGAGFAQQAALLAAGLALMVWQPLLSVPPVLSFLWNSLELRRMRQEAGLREPLTRVGMRTLAASILHMVATIACLWPLSRG